MVVLKDSTAGCHLRPPPLAPPPYPTTPHPIPHHTQTHTHYPFPQVPGDQQARGGQHPPGDPPPGGAAVARGAGVKPGWREPCGRRVPVAPFLLGPCLAGVVPCGARRCPPPTPPMRSPVLDKHTHTHSHTRTGQADPVCLPHPAAPAGEQALLLHRGRPGVHVLLRRVAVCERGVLTLKLKLTWYSNVRQHITRCGCTFQRPSWRVNPAPPSTLLPAGAHALPAVPHQLVQHTRASQGSLSTRAPPIAHPPLPTPPCHPTSPATPTPRRPSRRPLPGAAVRQPGRRPREAYGQDLLRRQGAARGAGGEGDPRGGARPAGPAVVGGQQAVEARLLKPALVTQILRQIAWSVDRSPVFATASKSVCGPPDRYYYTTLPCQI